MSGPSAGTQVGDPGVKKKSGLLAASETRARADVPRATYRLQFNRDFTFQQATHLIPYLSRLGVSHCYASPLLTSRPGSMHGYDITNHQALNPEIGTREEFGHFTSVLGEHGGGLILDIVPNHMGIGPDNPWWMDVLENGSASVYADYFDIDWEPITGALQGKVLLPILGDSYGQILENGEIQVGFEADSATFWLNYYEHRLPINPASYPTILAHRPDILAARFDSDNPAYLEYLSIVHAFEHLPSHIASDPDTRSIRQRETAIARSRLLALCEQEPKICAFVQENLLDFKADQADPTNLTRLHRLMEAQAYRLANWRVASDEINYRRFFDINDLAALRVEDPKVFLDTHALILDLVKNRQITGLRIDHPDGLFDPTGYFRHLQEEAASHLGLETSFDAASPEKVAALCSNELPLYLLAEKILAPYEYLPGTWTVHGTTGYEFANAVGGLFVESDHEKEMSRIYQRFMGRTLDFDELVYRCKHLIIRTSLTSEITVLAMQLKRIAERNWVTRDFTLNRLRDALTELVACFPVYRTYVSPQEIREKDREYIEWAVGSAKKRSTAVDVTIFDFIRQVLLMEFPEALRSEADEDLRRKVEVFAMKFQQYTGPVMAKGVEDTAFYRYNRLVSLNEVGGEPHRFGTSVAAFHHQNQERLKRTPHAMLTTSTHDTKRSEDVRARISVLSEMPDRWQKQLTRWTRMNRGKKTFSGKTEMPDRNDEYLLYQTLLGVWPLESIETLGEDGLKSVAGRVSDYMIKAIREAKVHTSWINQNQEYEDAVRRFVARLLEKKRHNAFLEDLVSFQEEILQAGLYNALSQTALKLTVPGVPDLYQGSELWDFSLVDPDNRRPVDYQRRQHYLDEMSGWLEAPDRNPYSEQLTDAMADGRIKMWVTAAILQYRRAHPDLFMQGEYIPLEATGSKAAHLVAFARTLGERQMIVVVPRLIHQLMGERYLAPTGSSVWKDTNLLLGPLNLSGPLVWENLFTGQVVNVESGEMLRLSGILENFPVAVLIR